MALIDQLKLYAKNQLNVLLVGTHGVGKTEMTKAVAQELGLKFQYYSAATLDPWTDIVGVPHPEEDEGGKFCEFYRPRGIEEAEFLMFDELNRAHPKTLNAVLEIVQFKSVNGTPLKNLKMIWAAINPPNGEYHVEELDPALVDRFHTYVSVKAEFNKDYMKSKLKEETSDILYEWWMHDMDNTQRKLITPRRLEYIGMLIDKAVPWKDALPLNTSLPHQDLAKRLKAQKSNVKMVKITKENILADPESFVKMIGEDPTVAIKVSNVIAKKTPPRELFAIRDLIEVLPQDIVHKLAKNKFKKIYKELFNLFKKENIDTKKYPKIATAYCFAEYE